ncbi:MAG: hypothetical protein AAGJ32_00915 [Pseudomonadota bacterium]
MLKNHNRADHPYFREGPVVTVLGDEEMNIQDAMPHPLMEASRRVWQKSKGLVKLGLFAAFAASYPGWMISSSTIDDAAVEIDADNWASHEAGVALTLIAREISGPGWSADKPGWHPVQHLTAQPAWQMSLSYSLADMTQLSAAIAQHNGEPDTDLAAASRLLRPVTGEVMTPRLIAAAEALASYDSRVANGVATDIGTSDQIIELLGLFVGWAEDSSRELSDQIALGAALPASKADIRAFYDARARAHVAANMINALLQQDQQLDLTASIRAQVREAKTKWRRIAQQSPMIVSNQSGNNPLLPNHLAAMAWHLDRAEAATTLLAEMLEGTREGDLSIAAADDLVLTPTSAP